MTLPGGLRLLNNVREFGTFNFESGTEQGKKNE